MFHGEGSGIVVSTIFVADIVADSLSGYHVSPVIHIISWIQWVIGKFKPGFKNPYHWTDKNMALCNGTGINLKSIVSSKIWN